MAKKPEAKQQPDMAPPAEGGSYVIENGVRRRAEEATKDHPEGNTNRDPGGDAIDYSGAKIAVQAKE